MSRCVMCPADFLGVGQLCLECERRVVGQLKSCDRCGCKLLPKETGLCEKCDKAVKEETAIENETYTYTDETNDVLRIRPSAAISGNLSILIGKTEPFKCVIISPEEAPKLMGFLCKWFFNKDKK